MKRILTIQDISCVGKCSLTVALPVISSFGIETAVLPTAVLSTHTAFKNFTFRDLTEDLTAVTETWKKENISFDGIYTGYLGSFKQLEIVSRIVDEFKTPENFILIDPVMADNGELYKGFDKNFALRMASLCAKADIIVPNVTEACFLLNIPYIGNDYNEDNVRNILKKLTDLGCKKAVLTGVDLGDGLLGVYGYDKTLNTYFSYFKKRLPKNFHGTGDVFASTMCGALTIGKNFQTALEFAVDYTVESINETLKNPNANWYGVDFESTIPYLIKKIKN